MEREYLSLELWVFDLINGNKQSEGGKRRTKEDRIGEGRKEQEAQSVWISFPSPVGEGGFASDKDEE